MRVPEFRIVGIGEVLWDLLPAGKQLGGAPANFVCHAHALGASAQLISQVGNDEAGREVIERFRALGVPTETIRTDESRPTGSVSVEVDAAGHPQYVIHENVAWDYIEVDTRELDAVVRADAVCFGSLAQRTPHVRVAVEKFLWAAQAKALRIFDINLRPPFIDDDVIADSLEAANVLKLNEHELPVLARLFGLKGSRKKQLAALADRFALRLIALTLGADGSMLFSGGQLVHEPAPQIIVRDTVGAGDSFTAAMVIGTLRNWPLERIARQASAIAAYVCSQAGATPPLPQHLRAPFLAAAGSASSPV